MVESTGDATRWGLILAGGDGIRLRPLTRHIAGDERPKQFCAILGRETLLGQTRCRVELSVPGDRILTIVTRAHHRFYEPLTGAAPPRLLLVQPENRGTTAAILYALLRVTARTPLATVAIFPSDHYVSDDGMFMRHVEAAFRAVGARPDLVVLLGITPESAEPEYGWIEPAEAMAGTAPIDRVRRFWEKPSPDLAQDLLRRRCLWNSFVMVGQASAFLALIRMALPGVWAAFSGLTPALDTLREADAARGVYARLEPSGFSEDVLARCPSNLGVLPVVGVGWSDLGKPRRVWATLATAGLRPAWTSVRIACSA